MADESDVLEVTRAEDGTIIVTGDVDAHSVVDLSREIDSRSGAVVLDLGGVGFIDSSGIRVLVETHSRCRDVGNEFRIVAVSAPVRRLFEITGLTGYLLGEVDESN
ncbi:MAG: STAS domain-containing protein [Actinomycetota bacterium]